MRHTSMMECYPPTERNGVRNELAYAVRARANLHTVVVTPCFGHIPSCEGDVPITREGPARGTCAGGPVKQGARLKQRTDDELVNRLTDAVRGDWSPTQAM